MKSIIYPIIYLFLLIILSPICQLKIHFHEDPCIIQNWKLFRHTFGHILLTYFVEVIHVVFIVFIKVLLFMNICIHILKHMLLFFLMKQFLSSSISSFYQGIQISTNMLPLVALVTV